MAIKPILFNTEMVRAILDGRKTCTRRICKDANECTVPDMEFYNADKRTYAVHNFADKEQMEQLSTAERTCPICTGDILYVRETWKEAPKGYYYYEDWQKDDIADVTKWKPSIHMPKEAARIWLKVTDVRVERLQENAGKCCKRGNKLTMIKKAKRRNREKSLQEMLFMMFRSAARDRYKLG